jgi:hypothetical protein
MTPEQARKFATQYGSDAMRLAEETIADARRTSEQYRGLRTAVGDVRLVGGLFVVLGLLPMTLALLSVSRRGDSWGARLMAIVNTVVLLGPGIWYFAAGTMMRRLSRPALRQAVWVARAQLVIVPCALLIGIFAGPVGFEREIFIVPVVLTIFFVPALIALLFTFRRIAGLMNAIEPEARGFEALPVQVLPLAAEGAKPQAASTRDTGAV